MIWAYLLALLVGLTLGLIGGGGSILTVPILVYVAQVPALQATTYSLFVVGSASAVGAWQHHKMGLIQWRAAWLFGLPSLVTVFAIRYWLLPVLPPILFNIYGFTASRDGVLLIFFAAIMLLAAYGMLQSSKAADTTIIPSPTSLSLRGLLAGAVTGLVGAGGGFLIVPALMFFAGLGIQQAIGTSLFIIAINSAVGFASSAGLGPVNWSFLLLFTGVAVAGIFVGGWLKRFVPSQKLKPAFGWFVLVMAAVVLGLELL